MKTYCFTFDNNKLPIRKTDGSVKDQIASTWPKDDLKI